MGHRRILAAFAPLFLCLVGCVNAPHPEAADLSPMQAFLKTEPARKLDPALQSQLLDLEKKMALDESIDVILGLKAPLTDLERGQLQYAGVTLRSVVGTIATASVRAREVPAVASLAFIARIESPMKLTPKGERNEP